MINLCFKLFVFFPLSFQNAALLNRIFISKSCGTVSYSTGRQVKVHISRKEHYRDSETPFYTDPKPGESIFTNYLAFVNTRWTVADIRHWWKKKAVRELVEDQKLVFDFISILQEIFISITWLLVNLVILNSVSGVLSSNKTEQCYFKKSLLKIKLSKQHILGDFLFSCFQNAKLLPNIVN